MLRSIVLVGLCLMAGSAAALETNLGKGAILRGLDKVGGRVSDLEIGNGGQSNLGSLRIELGECRYPKGNASGEAYAFLTIRENGKTDPVFSGWMIASAPALNPLDHARYDVWVLRCKTK